MKHICENNPYCASDYVLFCAIAGGHMDCIKWICDRRSIWNDEICQYAATYGHLNCLQWLHAQGAPLSKDICKYAAKSGHFECLKWLHESGAPYDNDDKSFYSIACKAAASGNLKCLQYACSVMMCKLTVNVCTNAAINGSLECLRWLHEVACAPWDESTCEYAAQYGHLDCLKYAHTHGCPWNKNTCIEAIRHNQTDTLTYAVLNGAPLDNTMISSAAWCADLDRVKLLYNAGLPIPETICGYIVSNVHDRVDMLEWVYEHGIIPSSRAYNPAMSNGNLNCLKWLHEKGIPWPTEPLKYLTKQCFLYAVANGCPWKETETIRTWLTESGVVPTTKSIVA